MRAKSKRFMSKGFTNTSAWRAAVCSTSSPSLHVTADDSLTGWQRLMQRSRWFHLTKAAGSNRASVAAMEQHGGTRRRTEATHVLGPARKDATCCLRWKFWEPKTLMPMWPGPLG